MPPKAKAGKKTAKSVAAAKGASNGGRVLRPKKGTDFKQLSTGKKPEKAKPLKKDKPAKVDRDEDNVSLTAGSDFDESDSERGVEHGNMSNSATPESRDNDTDSHDSDIGAEGDEQKYPEGLSKEVRKMVGVCMKEYARKSKAKKRKRGRKHHKKNRVESSTSESENDSTSSSSGSDDSEHYSSDESYQKERKRRKRSTQKKKKRKDKRSGKTKRHQGAILQTVNSPSQSTVYTRGCKSPDKPVITGSSDTDSQRSGHIDSEADTDEFIASLQNSINHSTPIADRRRSKDRSPGDQQARDEDREELRNRRLAEQEETSRREAAVRDRADDVIRDIQRNKADLAKPTGEWRRELETILIDMRHFHLTSHVDRKLKNQILDGDFTVDFKRLVPQSRSRCKTDQRLQVVNKDGISCFVPADRDNFKDITGYRQWEVAFKVFMGVYVSKWTDRAQELLQYSHTIQTASLTYPWENVFNYDIAIRELMTDNPGRLWSKICQHTWAMELGEPTNKIGYASSSNVGAQVQKTQRRVCWKFNKGRCNFGVNCEFDHRCSVCGGRNHGRYNCYKRGKSGEKGKEKGEIKKERYKD